MCCVPFVLVSPVEISFLWSIKRLAAQLESREVQKKIKLDGAEKIRVNKALGCW